MSDVHCEREALISHTITISEFDSSHYESGSDAPLRIYLEQPSPLWKTYSLENITFVGSVSGGRRRSSQTKSSSSAWPPVGSAGASLMRNVSHLNSPARGDDLWSSNNSSSPYASDQQSSSLPGSTLDRLSRAISAEMSIIRSTNILGKSQASAFLALDSDGGEPADSERNGASIQAEVAPTNSRRSSSARGWR
ncbi:hypothetical protein TrRE_jg2371 [Triparma retinervis]|uniref:Uncharacterized protein n=1 Tax=Triparma retinervis TaxID=2557542 RepID=A0A9W6Z9Y7_9STRA|nr:hypothetical protein TrRE_jg2371 [Triparma retinervis]